MFWRKGMIFDGTFNMISFVKKPLCMDNVSGFELQSIWSIDCNKTIVGRHLKMTKENQIMLNRKIKMVTN
jgi:hypothetical protein